MTFHTIADRLSLHPMELRERELADEIAQVLKNLKCQVYVDHDKHYYSINSWSTNSIMIFIAHGRAALKKLGIEVEWPEL